MKKFMLRVMPIVLVALLIVGNTVFAADVNSIWNAGNTGGGVSKVDNAVSKVWATVLTVLQIAAVGAIVFAGVKYMFAAADQKAEIKNGMIGLVVGAILVFAASTVVQFIINASKEVIQ